MKGKLNKKRTNRPFYESVAEFIRQNGTIDSPISGSAVGSHFGIKDSEVRKYINEARSAGVPICSAWKGYYYSEDPIYIVNTIESLLGRVAAQNKAVAGLRSFLDKSGILCRKSS